MVKRAPAYGLRAAGLVCVAAVFAACSGLATAVNSPSNNTTRAPGTLAGGVQFMLSGGGPQLQAYQALVTLYQQRYPGETVNLIGIPGQPDFQKRLASDIAAGRTADVILERYTDVPGLEARGILSAVAPYLAASKILTQSQFSTAALDPFDIDGQVQCVPLSVSGLVVYYNKDLFHKAGLAAPSSRWTKQEFAADAQALTRDTNGDGHPDQYGLGVEPSLTNLAPYIWQLKGQLVDQADWPTELTLRTPMALSATTWLVSLQSQYHVVPDAEAELAASSEQRFLDGTLAMIISSRASVPAYREISAFDWDVAPLPANTSGTTNVVVADGLCLASSAADKSAAWRFIEFAASPEGQSLLAQSGVIVPTLASVARSSTFLDPAARPAHSQVFLDTLAHARALPRLDNWIDIQAIADEELQQAFYGEKGVTEALTAAETRSEEYFKFHAAH